MFRPLEAALVVLVALAGCTVGGGLPPGTLILMFTAEPNAIVVGMGSGSVMMKWDVALEASAMITPAPGAVVNRGEQAMSPVTTTTFTLTATSSEGSETKSITVYVWENDPYPNDFIREAHETLVAEVTAAGLNPFAFKLDPTDGTQKHVEYCITNLGKPNFVCDHTESPAFDGFSEEGKIAASRMVIIGVGNNNLIEATENFLFSLLHRVTLVNVDRQWTYIGYTSVTLPNGSIEGFLGINVADGITLNASLRRSIIFPYYQQQLKRGIFASETPFPFVLGENRNYGVSFTWQLDAPNAQRNIQFIEGTVVDESGNDVPLAEMTEEAIQWIIDRNTVAVTPLDPLKPNEWYTATIRVRFDNIERETNWSAMYSPP